MSYSVCPNCFNNSFNGSCCTNCKYIFDDDENDFALEAYNILDNRYIVGRVLGSGGFGITYVAYDILNKKRCAIKEFVPMGIVVRDSDKIHIKTLSQKNANEFKRGVSRFMEEAKTIEQLNNIPNIVHVIDYFEANGTAYYVMEYLDGVTLKSIISASETGVDAAIANKIIVDIGETLDLIHKKKGYLHRDISPENIMILNSGEVVIIDFGSAKNYFMNGNSHFTVTLKHGFAPPEQYTSTGRQGPYTDLYALASTYYYMLTGKMIPSAPDRLSGVAYTPLRETPKNINSEISEAVDKALELKANNRTQTVSEFIEKIKKSKVDTKINTILNSTEKTEKESECEDKDKKEELTKKSSATHTSKLLNPYVIVRVDGVNLSETDIEKDVVVKVGRSDIKSDIVFEGCGNISSFHCNIFFDSNKNQFYIEDHSLNGTYINNKRIDKNEKVYINGDDVVVLANTRYRLILGVK